MNPGISHQTIVLQALSNSCKAIDVLSAELELSHRQVSDAAAGLIRKGLVERAEIGCFRPTREGEQAIVNGVQITSGPKASFVQKSAHQKDTLRQRAWNVMRIQKSFTINDLILTCTHGSEQNAENNLQRYCSYLAKFGVLRRMKRRVAGTRPSSNGFIKYQLLRDLGEKAPTMCLKRKSLFDHNSGEELTNG